MSHLAFKKLRFCRASIEQLPIDRAFKSPARSYSDKPEASTAKPRECTKSVACKQCANAMAIVGPWLVITRHLEYHTSPTYRSITYSHENIFIPAYRQAAGWRHIANLPHWLTKHPLLTYF